MLVAAIPWMYHSVTVSFQVFESSFARGCEGTEQAMGKSAFRNKHRLESEHAIKPPNPTLLLKKPAAATGNSLNAVTKLEETKSRNAATKREEKEKETYMCPATACMKCGFGLTNHHRIDAVCYGFEGPRDVVHMSKQCINKGCRTVHAFNYFWEKSPRKKVNSFGTCDFDRHRVLFVNSKLAFDTKYLSYHASLQFKGFLSARTISWAGKDALGVDERGGDSVDATWMRLCISRPF